MRRSLCSPLAAIALAAARHGARPQPDSRGGAAGKPESCISIASIRADARAQRQVIDFEMTGGKVYRNTLPNGCPGLGFAERFAYQTSLSQLCSTDIITVLDSPPVHARRELRARPVPAGDAGEKRGVKRTGAARTPLLGASAHRHP